MNKYIDAEKLRSVLQNTINSMKEKDAKGERYDAFLNGKLSICEELLGCIDSLQQDKETLMLEMCNQSFWEDRGYIMIPPDVTIEGIESLLKQVKKKLQQEQPEGDLEKEVQRWKNKHGVVGMDDLWLKFARHFYELGLNAKKDR